IGSNWQELGSFRRDTAPAIDTDEVRVGDLWFDLSTNELNKATATGPEVQWTPVATAGGSSIASGLFFTDGAAVNWSLDTTPDELVNSPSYHYFTDLTGKTVCKLWMRQATATTNA